MAGQTGGGGGVGSAIVTEVAQAGFLIGASVFTHESAEEFFATYVTLDVMRGGTEVFNRVFQIGHGYVSEDVSLSVNCFFQTREEDSLFMRVRGDLNPAFHVKYFYLDKPITEFLLNGLKLLSARP